MIKITIEKIEEVTTTPRNGNWTVVSKEYIDGTTYQDLPREEQRQYRAIEHPNNGLQYEKSVYGYLEPEPVTKEVTTQIYSQLVSDLDISEVIGTINASARRLG